MRLKTLEIKGFKSFADKTVLNFDERITGVVGPNGCGKSNIVDSIRWVIGEHKISNLRSENLEGLVFNGSRTRSASGLAEVSLTFENTRNILPTEFTTVTITRKFFKNGESEYRLNDVACRLKDIHNLFLDTGVSNDSYAIIELGMVDDIIRDKDNSRRRMLEQAAGISLYKTRKKEARLKLDATESDLSRIEDLLFEIGNNLKTLEAQAKKAEKYQELRREYKVLSIELAKASLEGFQLLIRDLNEQLDDQTDKKASLEARIALEEADLERRKIELLSQEQGLQEQQRKFNDLNGTIRNMEHEKSLAAQQLGYLEESEKNLLDFLQGATGQLEGLDQSLTLTSGQLEQERLRVGELQELLNLLKTRSDEHQKDFQLQRTGLDLVRLEQQAVQRELFEAEKKAAVTESTLQNLQGILQQTAEEKLDREGQMAGLREELNALESQLDIRQEDLGSLMIRREETRGKILEAQQELEQYRESQVERSRRLDARKNEYDLLYALVENLEGYPESIKFLRKHPGWKQDTPILSDIIFCREPYRAAIENLLEPYLNYYVSENAAEALKAIRLLDAHQKGKANFFLLDRFPALLPTLSKAPEGTSPALEAVELEEKYRGLGHFLLGRVFLADHGMDLDSLPLSDGMVILEMDGKLSRGQYYLGGGSSGLFEGRKLGRAKNLEKMQEEIGGMEGELEELHRQIRKVQDRITGLNEDLGDQLIQETRDEVNLLQQQAQTIRNRLEHLGNLMESGQTRIQETHSRVQDHQEGLTVCRESVNRLEEQILGKEEQVRNARDLFESAERTYNESLERFNDMNLQLTRSQSREQGILQELEFKSRQLEDLGRQIDRNQTQLAETRTGLQEALQKLNAADIALLELFRIRDEDQQALNLREQDYDSFRNQLGEQESILRQIHRDREGTESSLNGIKDQINEVRLRLASIKERLQVEFKVNLEDILDEPRTRETPLEQLQSDTDKFRKRLENMGEINPTAIETFQEMKARYEFILEQKNDLVGARESLLSTIQEVEVTANQRFLETFNQVKEHFIRVYRTLSSEEDQCDLVLLDPDNLSESGLDIIAKPKGKRPTSIGQLSMGEKTLVATALLFAIYLIKPAPFCILDEVDAPLDDNNVTKFTNMIRQFASESQFIIVTHNKQTMAAVDVIYGVTMQEAGVSKLVPVDFRSLN